MSAPMSKMPAAKAVMPWTNDVASWFTCHICHKIKCNSTSITECIHSFCKKCIIKKFTEEKLNSCPICNTDLGCTPLRKLRPDHNFQSLAATLFLSIKKNTKEPDVSAREAKEIVTAQAEDEEPEMRSIPKPARRKKKSLSSFVNNPNISREMLPTGKRKPVPKKFPSFVSNKDPVRKVEDRPESLTSHISRKNARNKKQLSISQLYKKQVSSKDAGPSSVWDLNSLPEAVDTTKGSKSCSQGIVFKTPPSTIAKENPNFSKDKRKEYGNTSNYIILDDEEDPKPAPTPAPAPAPAPAPPVSVKQKRTARSRQKRSVAPFKGVRVSAQAVVDANASENIGRRKPVPKKFPSFVSNEDPVRKLEDRPESSTSSISRKNERNRKQLNISQPSKQQVSYKDAGQSNVWNLNYLADAVDTTKGSKSRSQGIVFKTPPSTIPKLKPNFSKDKSMEYGNTSNYIILDDDDEEEDPKPALAPPVSMKQKRKARGRQKRSITPSEGVRISAQTVVDANANKNIGMNSIWLSLVATYRQDVGPPLPQIPYCYLRIKNIHSPVSVIKKFLVRKLDLQSEDEVEIELLGQPVTSNMELYMLVDMWCQAVSERISTSVGRSARDFVVVLSYSRKA